MLSYKGGDGSNQEKAIIILGANNELEGVDAEYNYIERKSGFFDIETQLFIDEGSRKFDCLKIIGVNGNKREFWFDVTKFYGKEDA
jgi:hypothetical protein